METKNIALKLCRDFFFHLNQNQIQYCHWKSNSHLEKGLKGETDLDLLIDEGDRNRFQETLTRYRFIRILSHYLNQYPGMEDYLGFDPETGKLVHLHVHYKLILGQKFIKNHHLPIEKLVLEYTRDLCGVKIPCPEMELFLLVIRGCMKFGIRNIASYLVRRSPSLFPKDISKEFQFLLQDSDDEKFGLLIDQSNLNLSAQRIIDFIDCLKKGKVTLFKVLNIRHYIFKTLRPFRRHSTILSLKKLIRIYISLLPFCRVICPMPGKRLHAPGKSFGIVGADGSGKSTIVKDLYKWLSWKLEIKTFYFGIPKTFDLKLIRGILFSLRLISRLGALKIIINPIDFLIKFTGCHRWIWVAKRRLAIFNKIEKLIQNGIIVITDRYPFAPLWNMRRPMDGPRIKNEWGEVANRLAAREEIYYSQIALPDKIFILRVDLNELRRRKDDMALSWHRMKVKGVNQIKSSKKVYIINGNRPYAEVLLDIKRELWSSL